MNPNEKSLRDDIINEAKKRYKASDEHLWAGAPNDFILRRSDNRKWFAVVMNIDGGKLGLDGERASILNVKAEPEMIALLAGTPGYFPGYHMNKSCWLTVLLDGTVDRRNIFSLLDTSFELTAGGKRTGNRRGNAK
ncbi:MAG: MmcQ/YjbR family DNA-binding protein [Butyrivibrio sp.]|nr:MmcQ/YjbR family DNA-binding protein [Butyrivibrio sp.]